MKVLILSANTGQGHNSCAAAIKEVFEEHGDECEICDALALISKGASEFASNWHTQIYRHFPGAFRWGGTDIPKNILPYFGKIPR